MAFILLTKKRFCPIILSRFFSSSVPQNPNLKTSNFMVDYLTSSFGFSADKAVKVSKHIAHIKSPENPDAVLRFLKNQGFTEADIKRFVTWQPRIFLSNPDNTLEPNLCAIRNMGLSTSALNQIILSGPAALQTSYAVSRIKFWMDFLGGDEAALVKAFKTNRGLVTHDIAQVIVPKISLLQGYGLSTQVIGRIVCRITDFITKKVSVMEDKLNWVMELGSQPTSGMFLCYLHAVSYATREGTHKKMELFKSFGWSESAFLSALQKSPSIIVQPEVSLQAKMNFFTTEARCDPSYIASNPTLLTRSLEKRLRPRHHVLHILELKGLSRKGKSFLSAILMTDDKFVEKYILPHKGDISGLHEDYLAACALRSECILLEG